MLSQFTTSDARHRTLAEFGFPPNVYPIGRLDLDSEGLLLLSDEPALTETLLLPKQRHPRTYWTQVEGIPVDSALHRIEKGVVIDGRKTLPCHAKILDPQPHLPEREPPIRIRKSIPDCWIELVLFEGRNRQVRRMTAAIAHPTLRLVRVKIGGLELGKLGRGEWKIVSEKERALILQIQQQ